MNDLSWLIYLIGLFDSVKFTTAMLFVVGFLIYAVYVIATSISNSELYRSADERHKIRKYPAFILVFLLITLLITPDRKTMLLIAASEVGEKVFNNDKVINTVDPALELLQTWIKTETEKQLLEFKNLNNAK